MLEYRECITRALNSTILRDGQFPLDVALLGRATQFLGQEAGELLQTTTSVP